MYLFEIDYLFFYYKIFDSHLYCYFCSVFGFQDNHVNMVDDVHLPEYIIIDY